VKEAVARTKRHHQELFVPLSHPPGEAQFDFGEAATSTGSRRQTMWVVAVRPFGREVGRRGSWSAIGWRGTSYMSSRHHATGVRVEDRSARPHRSKT
jgi:hypothetical protein